MRTFSARETAWLQELDGIELASFWRRACAFTIDGVLISAALSALLMASMYGYIKVRAAQGHPEPTRARFNLRNDKFEIESDDPELDRNFENKGARLAIDLGVPVLYFGLLTWQGRGRSPGKRLLRIRVVSLVHRHLTLWHSVERSLGYGAAALEGGFGFAQFFIHPYRRCVQDRIAETIVVTERSYRNVLGAERHVENTTLPEDAQPPELPTPSEL